jgi:MoaA/NifB/PqqE/SkfB family radical SAM enzyme
MTSIEPGSGWFRLKQKALARAQPLAAYLELTYRCNWRCVFCYNPRHFDRRGLSAEEWTAVLDDLRALGTLAVTLTGGEPLAHPQFLDVARAAAARRFAVRIFTNGTLVSEEMADAIAALPPLAVEVSLHGATAATHERATRAPGSFPAMLRGLERLKARGVPLLVKSLVTSLNEHELDEMIALAEGLGVRHQVDATVTPRDDGDGGPLRYRASPSAIALMYRRTAERGRLPSAGREEGGVNCGLGRTTLAVDPEGGVYPCIQWRRSSLGNVRDTRLRDLWHGSTVREDAAALARAANEAMMVRGGSLAAFPFCPALAEQRTGDPLVPDAGHEEQARIAADLRANPPLG